MQPLEWSSVPLSRFQTSWGQGHVLLLFIISEPSTVPDVLWFTMCAGCSGGYVNTFYADTWGVKVPVWEPTDIGSGTSLEVHEMIAHPFIHSLIFTHIHLFIFIHSFIAHPFIKYWCQMIMLVTEIQKQIRHSPCLWVFHTPWGTNVNGNKIDVTSVDFRRAI